MIVRIIHTVNSAAVVAVEVTKIAITTIKIATIIRIKIMDHVAITETTIAITTAIAAALVRAFTETKMNKITINTTSTRTRKLNRIKIITISI